MRRSLVLIAALVVAPTLAAALEDSALQLEGNLVLPAEVYRAVLTLAPGAPADQYTADAVRDQLQAFLMRAGYILSRVDTSTDGHAVYAQIDEGRVRRVVFRGRGSIKTLRFKLALDLPHNVFNLPHLQAELARLGRRFDVPDVTFQLVPANAVAHLGPQLVTSGTDLDEVLDMLAPLVNVRENGDYDLHVLFGDDARTTSVKVKTTLKAPDGLTTGLEYLGPGLIFAHDLWSIESLASVAYFDNLDNTSSPRWSRLRTGLRWLAPPLLDTALRPTIRAGADLAARQRLDLNVTRYHWATIDAALSLSRELREGLLLSLGGGYAYDHFWNIERQAGALGVIAPVERRRPFFEATAELTFDVSELRLDRRQELDLHARVNTGQRNMWRVSWEYQKVFAFGWHDLWLRSRGELMGGDVIIPEEASVGGVALHGVFASSIYAHRVTGVTAETRLSVTRDLFKVGLFGDLAAYEDL
ncbi:MAG: POTRA domain-containing protein, partial [Myxococcota bacterium]